MTRVKLIGFIVLCTVLLSFLAPAAHAKECGRQGAFALALAQLLGYEVTDQNEAMAILTNVGVEPNGGWSAKACVTAEMANEIDKDLKNAVSMGTFTPQDIAGVVALALESIGEADIVNRMQTMPNPQLGRSSRVGGPPMEGSLGNPEPPPPDPGPPPTRTSSRPPASPFVP